MFKVHSGLLAALLLTLAAVAAPPARAIDNGFDIKVGRELIMGGYFYMCEWACVVTRTSNGTWTVVDERGGKVIKIPIEYYPDR